MKRLTAQILTALGFLAVTTTVGLWSAPKLIAAVKAALVQNVDEPGRNPYQQTRYPGAACFGVNGNCVVIFPNVPAGKRLVVTAVSAQLDLVPGPGRRFASLIGNQAEETLTTIYQGSGGGFDLYNVSETVLAYFEPGDAPQISFYSDARIGSFDSCRISGYFITLP